jgi:hypothetical protein
VRRGQHLAIFKNQLNRFGTLLFAYLRESDSGVLIRLIVDGISNQPFPSADPVRTKAALPVPKHRGLVWFSDLHAVAKNNPIRVFPARIKYGSKSDRTLTTCAMRPLMIGYGHVTKNRTGLDT